LTSEDFNLVNYLIYKSLRLIKLPCDKNLHVSRAHPNYGERWRNNEIISSSFVESTVNQVVTKRMVKKQQMQWNKRGAAFAAAGANPGSER
jgi:hypothetical protein